MNTFKLFVYGSLRPDAPNQSFGSWIRAEIEAKFIQSQSATVKGHLYDMGGFPAVVLDDNGANVVGYVLTLEDDPGIKQALDLYEGVDHGFYVKSLVDVLYGDGTSEEVKIYVAGPGCLRAIRNQLYTQYLHNGDYFVR